MDDKNEKFWFEAIPGKTEFSVGRKFRLSL